ncbi:hypothetical protein QTP70_023129, partial [Hemibagrus guttatus]
MLFVSVNCVGVCVLICWCLCVN